LLDTLLVILKMICPAMIEKQYNYQAITAKIA